MLGNLRWQIGSSQKSLLLVLMAAATVIMSGPAQLQAATVPVYKNLDTIGSSNDDKALNHGMNDPR